MGKTDLAEAIFQAFTILPAKVEVKEEKN